MREKNYRMVLSVALLVGSPAFRLAREFEPRSEALGVVDVAEKIWLQEI